MSIRPVDPSVVPLTITRAQAMTLSGFGKHALDRALHSGELPSIKVGKPDTTRHRVLIRRVDFDAWLEMRARGKPYRQLN